MKAILRKFVKLLAIIIILLLVILIVSFINHRIQLANEEELFVPNGQLVKVNGHKLHVYAEGEGETPLIFMSGGGTSSPVLDFKSIYTLLSPHHKIAVVEKAGYGFSDIAEVNRDIDSILSETRQALNEAEIEGPYILIPHSMSGIEALYWAQTYPEEVKAIVGLDMSVPASYEDYEINIPLITLSSWAARMGITRWIPSIAESDAIKYGNLTEIEKAQYRVVFYRRTATSPMLKEVEAIKANASKVANGEDLSLPILIFSSNGQGTGWDENSWKRIHEEFIAESKEGQIVHLDSSHYVHNIEYERIAEEINQFITSLQ